MPDEVAAGGAGAAGAGGGAPSPGVGGSGMSAAEIAAPGGDVAFLEKPAPEQAPAETKPPEVQEETKPAEEAAPEEVDLTSLEEGQPEWLAKVSDPAAKAEVEKLLAAQKAFSEHFKDAADLEAFFKDLPGGREQIAAMQTLTQEVSELDAALESNTPEGNLEVAERYLGMTPDGGLGLFRAAAQHMAKSSPEAWNQVSAELVNSTLHANGIGADLPGVLSAIAELRAAVQADDGEAFGRAAGRLLGTPKEAPKTDPALVSLTERENTARAEATRAQAETWSFRRDAGAQKIETYARTEIGKLLAKALPASISEKDKNGLLEDISNEVGSQVVSNAWLMSQVQQLIGQRVPDGKGGYAFDKTNLKATQADFDKASKLMIDAADGKLIARAVAKIVSKWSKDRAAGNADARARARNAATKTDVGAGKTVSSGNGKQPLSEEALKKMSDAEFLNY
jgi:hypothetical protein